MDDTWAVFVYRDTVFHERRSTLKRIPVIERWYEWETLRAPARAEWITDRARLGQFLTRSTRNLAEFDKDRHHEQLGIMTSVAQFAAVLAWARTNDLVMLTQHFTYEQMMQACDYLCADVAGDTTGDKPYYLSEIVGWGRTRDMRHRTRNPCALLARTLLWMTPSALEALIAFVFTTIALVILVATVSIVYFGISRTDVFTTEPYHPTLADAIISFNTLSTGVMRDIVRGCVDVILIFTPNTTMA